MKTPSNRESRGKVIRRRLVTIPRSIILFLLVVALAPLLIPMAVLIDLARWLATRRPAMTLRLLAYGFVFLAAEVLGLIWLLLSWVQSGFGARTTDLRENAWPIQIWWAQTLLNAAIRIFRLEITMSGQESVAPGPILALFRHASIVDNLLPAVLITHQVGVRLRWVIKRELLTVPALDVAGNRLPNHFVDRHSADPTAELAHIRALAADMGENDGVLIYPEGTRFSPARLRRALERMRQADDAMLSRATRLRHVMPPRLGGTSALLDSGADVVIGAHQGLEGFAKLPDLWSGALVGKRISVAFTRIPASTIPTGRHERADWLYDTWTDLDQWIHDRIEGEGLLGAL